MHFDIYTQMDLLLRVPQRTSSSTYLQERHFSVYHSATHSNARENRAVFLFLFILEIREYIHYIRITNLYNVSGNKVS